MSRMCIINKLFSISNTYLILFLSISTYIHNCIIARMHFVAMNLISSSESFADIKGDYFRFHLLALSDNCDKWVITDLHCQQFDWSWKCFTPGARPMLIVVVGLDGIKKHCNPSKSIAEQVVFWRHATWHCWRVMGVWGYCQPPNTLLSA